jgi:cystathionine beta-lyase/cystathionine gamma-synthase
MTSKNKSTQCIHEGTYLDEAYPGVNTPIYTSTSYRYPNKENQVWYPRYFNTPGQVAVAKKMAALECGEAALVFASGMAAISTSIMALCQQGDHILVQDVVYGGTHHFAQNYLPNYGIEVGSFSAVDLTSLESSVKSNTKVIYLETPSNPLLGITDIAAIARFAKERGILTVIDNTFATPINQNPIKFGIDVVLHSGTKYLSGHSDICCGAAVTSDALIKKIAGMAKCLGGDLDARACYELERSLKTLAVRVEKHNGNAMAVAKFLHKHEKTKKVYYPGLPEHPGHEVAAEQMQGFGGMLAFELKEGDSEQFMKKLHTILPAVSLGGVESLICSPAKTSHALLSKEEREKIGVTDGLLRLSVGIEEVGDIVADLEAALVKK